MSRTSFFAAIIVAAGCSGPEFPDLPPIAIGGGGARLMTDARTPAEAYDNAYSRLTGLHLQVRDSLSRMGMKNVAGAKAALDEIVENLEILHSLLSDPAAKEALRPYVIAYRELAADVERGRYGANWKTQIDQAEREIKSRFAPSKVAIMSSWPPGREPTPPDAAKPAADASTPEPPPPPVPSYRLAFQAWKQSHADLTERFKNSADCAGAYASVLEAVDAMKSQLPEARRAKLELMRSVYEQQHAETSGFTKIPEHGSKELILRQLGIVQETLEREYDPEKK
ncbi:MAG: hypothetical protein HY716_09535 [Planctomycetes bacterium]|nr:hypothetical protein [Planctomycetota bacterium]